MSIAKVTMAGKTRSRAHILSSEPFMKAFYQSSVPSLIIDRDDRSVVEVNESFLKIFEYTREEVIGFTAASLNLYYYPAERAGVLQVLDERGSLRDYEFTGQTKTGRVLKLLLSAVDVAFDDKHYIVVSGMDITDRKQSEEKLKKSEAMLARAQEIAHIGHWERDIPSQRVLWSDEAYRIFGFKPQELDVDESLFLEHIHPDDRTLIENNIRDAIENGRTLDDEFRIIRSDGTIRWIRGKGEITRAEDGTPVQLFGTILDITERKEAEEQLRESEEKYRTLVEQADDGIILVQDAVVKYANPRMGELLGYTANELTGAFIADHIDPAEIEKVTGRHRRRLAGEELPSIYEVFLKRRDGTSVQTELNVGVVTYSGKPATQVIIRDITERKRIEEALRSSEEAAMAVLNASQEIIFLIDTSGIVLTANTATARAIGADIKDIVGRCIFDLLPDDVEQIRRSATEEVVRTGKPVQFEDRSMDRSFYSTIYPVFNDSGQVARLVIYAQDITGRKRMEEDLRKSRQELEQRVEERTEELQKAYDRLLSEIKQRRLAEGQLIQTQKMEAVGNLAGGIATISTICLRSS